MHTHTHTLHAHTHKNKHTHYTHTHTHTLQTKWSIWPQQLVISYTLLSPSLSQEAVMESWEEPSKSPNIGSVNSKPTTHTTSIKLELKLLTIGQEMNLQNGVVLPTLYLKWARKTWQENLGVRNANTYILCYVLVLSLWMQKPLMCNYMCIGRGSDRIH